MRRSRWSRFFAVVAGGLLAVTLIEPPHARMCPMHDGRAAHTVAQTAAPAHAHHASPATTVGVSPIPADDGGECCTCLGECVGTPGVAAVLAQGRSAGAVHVLTQDPPAVNAGAPATRAGLRLPFANGPPIRA